MNSVIKEFEKILYNSLVYYPQNNKNIASTFKVILPEIYYEKFRELNDVQKNTIADFVFIFLDKLFKSENFTNKKVKEGFLNFNYDASLLLNKQNIMNYIINFFSECINPYHDVKMLNNATYDVEIENNQIGSTKFKTFIGKHLPLNNCGSHIIVKISSKYQDKIVEFMEKHKLGILFLRTNKK